MAAIENIVYVQTKPGFTAEEIQHAYNNGMHIAAIKMLRAETGCSLSDAVAACRHGIVEQMPEFQALKARRKAERYGPQLLEALKELTDWAEENFDPPPKTPFGDCIKIINARGLLNEIEKAK